MKKIGTAMLVTLLTLIMVIATTACGNNGGSPVVGTWKMKIDADKVPDDQKAMVQMIESALNVTFTFEADGKVKADATASLMGESSSTSSEGTWTQDGNIYTIQFSGSDTTGMGITDSGKMELRDGKLYMLPPETSSDDSEASSASVSEYEYMYFEKQ